MTRGWRPISSPVHRHTHLVWLPGVEPDTSPRGLDLLGFEVAALMHNRDDEYLALAQVIEDAPGIGGNLGHLLVVEFGDFAAAEGRGLYAVGEAPNLACDGLGVLRRIFGDVIVKGFEVGAGALRPVHHDAVTTARSRAREPRWRSRGRRRYPVFPDESY